jgi:hypothetical protein
MSILLPLSLSLSTAVWPLSQEVLSVSCGAKPCIIYREVLSRYLGSRFFIISHNSLHTVCLWSGEKPPDGSLNQITNLKGDPLYSYHITLWCSASFREIHEFNCQVTESFRDL